MNNKLTEIKGNILTKFFRTSSSLKKEIEILKKENEFLKRNNNKMKDLMFTPEKDIHRLLNQSKLKNKTLNDKLEKEKRDHLQVYALLQIENEDLKRKVIESNKTKDELKDRNAALNNSIKLLVDNLDKKDAEISSLKEFLEELTYEIVFKKD